MQSVSWNLVLEYGTLVLVGGFSGLLFAIKTLGEKRKKWRIVQHIFLAGGSSMLVAWISYEIIKEYFKLNYGLATAISAGIGYLGAEFAGKFILDFLLKKLKEKRH
ncbi:holin [Helicobacter ailurogastricus]|uniref:holin n=1 Tax=Helicobacter ailurogastricus TaxID=1578720 RepID=UPI000CF16213|nr:holin [Helicobacter ailurogastricus]GMB90580.1 holin [Helicobacter ailurogastricus]